jgi:transcriptional regulator with XRE-family HTH domain
MPRTNFDDFLARALRNPEVRAAYEDSQSRHRLVDALVRMRHRLGMTQTQVARRMGVKQPSISGFETEGSDPRLSTLQRYARSVDAVLVWDVRPRLEVAYVDGYAPSQVNVHLGVNKEEPSERAKTWRPSAAYAPLHAVA